MEQRIDLGGGKLLVEHSDSGKEFDAYEAVLEQIIQNEERPCYSVIAGRVTTVHPTCIVAFIRFVCEGFGVPVPQLAYDESTLREHNIVAAYVPFRYIIVTPETHVEGVVHEIAHHLCACESIDASSKDSVSHGPMFMVAYLSIIMFLDANVQNLVEAMIDAAVNGV